MLIGYNAAVPAVSFQTPTSTQHFPPFLATANPPNMFNCRNFEEWRNGPDNNIKTSSSSNGSDKRITTNPNTTKRESLEARVRQWDQDEADMAAAELKLQKDYAESLEVCEVIEVVAKDESEASKGAVAECVAANERRLQELRDEHQRRREARNQQECLPPLPDYPVDDLLDEDATKTGSDDEMEIGQASDDEEKDQDEHQDDGNPQPEGNVRDVDQHGTSIVTIYATPEEEASPDGPTNRESDLPIRPRSSSTTSIRGQRHCSTCSSASDPTRSSTSNPSPPLPKPPTLPGPVSLSRHNRTPPPASTPPRPTITSHPTDNDNKTNPCRIIITPPTPIRSHLATSNPPTTPTRPSNTKQSATNANTYASANRYECDPLDTERLYAPPTPPEEGPQPSSNNSNDNTGTSAAAPPPPRMNTRAPVARIVRAQRGGDGEYRCGARGDGGKERVSRAGVPNAEVVRRYWELREVLAKGVEEDVVVVKEGEEESEEDEEEEEGGGKQGGEKLEEERAGIDNDDDGGHSLPRASLKRRRRSSASSSVKTLHTASHGSSAGGNHRFSELLRHGSSAAPKGNGESDDAAPSSSQLGGSGGVDDGEGDGTSGDATAGAREGEGNKQTNVEK